MRQIDEKCQSLRLKLFAKVPPPRIPQLEHPQRSKLCHECPAKPYKAPLLAK
jgi:hypothetical protein